MFVYIYIHGRGEKLLNTNNQTDRHYSCLYVDDTKFHARIRNAILLQEGDDNREGCDNSDGNGIALL